MDPIFVHMWVGLGACYCVPMLLLMVAMVRTAKNIREAATKTANVPDRFACDIHTISRDK